MTSSDTQMQDLNSELQHLSTKEYPKPPYPNSDQVFVSDPCVLQPTTVRRAMERDGRMFKKMTHWIAGVKYIYWHEDKQATEVWYKSERNAKANNDVCSFQQVIQCMEERLVFSILRPTLSKHTPSMDTPPPEENLQENEEVAWAQQRLELFKSTAEYRTFFEIPDWTTYGYPSWTITPTMAALMDSNKLYAKHLPQGETLIYDRHHCTFAWIRRDGAAYEIRAHYESTVVFAQRLILKMLVQVVCGLIETRQYQTIPPNAGMWADAYFWLQQNAQFSQKQRKHPHKHRHGTKGHSNERIFQARKGKKRQRLRNADTSS